MKLSTYLKRRKLRYTPWATNHKISPAVIYRLFNGHTISMTNAVKIMKATGYEVTLTDLAKKDTRK